MAELLERPRLRLRRRLDPLRRRRRARLRPLRHLVGGELAREGVADVLRVAGAGRARAGCSTSSPTPTSSSTGAAERPRPDGDLRRYYDLAMEGDRRVGHRGRGLDRRAAQARRRAVPGAGVPGDGASMPATRSRCPATPTRPRTSAATTTRRSSSSASSASSELAVFERPRAAPGADRMTASTGIGWDSHRLVAGRAADPRRRRHRPRARPRRPLRRRRAHPRGHRRAARRRRRWATSASTSPTPTSVRVAPTRSQLLRDGRRARSPSAGFAIVHVDATVVMERPKLAPHRDAIRASLAEALGAGARAGQRQGLDRRGDGLRRARRGRRRAGGGHGAAAA